MLCTPIMIFQSKFIQRRVRAYKPESNPLDACTHGWAKVDWEAVWLDCLKVKMMVSPGFAFLTLMSNEYCESDCRDVQQIADHILMVLHQQ